MAQAYKRICFRGRGIVARWMDRAFFALLGGVCLYLLSRYLLLSWLLSLAMLTAFLLWENKRWTKYKRGLWQKTVQTLKREAWLRQEAERIQEASGTILYPTPKTEELTGFCLRYGIGTEFHCFGEAKRELVTLAERYGCTLTFHPWQEGTEPGREQVLERLRRDAPKREGRLLPMLLHLPGNRYLLTGCLLLLLSVFLRRALYWRLLGSLCLFVGAVSRAIHMPFSYEI